MERPEGIWCLRRARLKEIVQEAGRQEGEILDWEGRLYLTMQIAAGLLRGFPKVYLNLTVPCLERRFAGPEPELYHPGFSFHICQDLERAAGGRCVVEGWQGWACCGPHPHHNTRDRLHSLVRTSANSDGEPEVTEKLEPENNGW